MDATQSVTLGTCLFLSLLGLVAIGGGIFLFLKALRRAKRCTQVVAGRITQLVDEDFGAASKRRREEKAEARAQAADEQKVLAANEAIAAKKRSYMAKKRAEARTQSNATAATWRAVVTYAVGDQTYQARATRAVPQKTYKMGQPCEVHYDPTRPSYCWLQIDGLPRTFGIILMACGVGLILLGLACYYVLPVIADLSNGL